MVLEKINLNIEMDFMNLKFEIWNFFKNISWGVKVMWRGCYNMKKWAFEGHPIKQHG
jgi:hypothetical protein